MGGVLVLYQPGFYPSQLFAPQTVCVVDIGEDSDVKLRA
jgi:hypothetical protein